MSFTTRGSVSSFFASAWWVTAHTGTSPGSITAARGPAARSASLSPSRSVTNGSRRMGACPVPGVIVDESVPTVMRACLQGRGWV
ncbi:hypothetical protein SGRIM128S_09345 [Streptomyces griseomycini]